MDYEYSESLDKHNELRRKLGFNLESEDIVGGARYTGIGYVIKEPKKVETYAKVLEYEDYRNIRLLPNVRKGATLPTETVHKYEMADGQIYTKYPDYILVYSKDLTPEENALLVSDFLNLGIYMGSPMDFLQYHLRELDDCIGSELLTTILSENLDLESEHADEISDYINNHREKTVREKKEEELYKLIERNRNLKNVEKMSNSILMNESR